MSAYDYKEILAKHADPAGRGCVMLDVKPLPISEYISKNQQSRCGAQDPEKKWVTGFQTGEQHITLKYGLIQNANAIKEDIDALLDGIDFFADPPFIGGVEVFEQDAPYSCIVGLLETGLEGDEDPGSLYIANERLSYIPHIDTFPTYRPHVTLGYVYDEWVDTVLDQFIYGGLVGTVLEPIRLNYGYPEEEN